MKQTAMQQLLAQLKDERANLPMSKEWDRCYQAIEMVIQNTYISVEREQIIDDYFQGVCDESDSHGAQSLDMTDAEKYYNAKYGK